MATPTTLRSLVTPDKEMAMARRKLAPVHPGEVLLVVPGTNFTNLSGIVGQLNRTVVTGHRKVGFRSDSGLTWTPN